MAALFFINFVLAAIQLANAIDLSYAFRDRAPTPHKLRGDRQEISLQSAVEKILEKRQRQFHWSVSTRATVFNFHGDENPQGGSFFNFSNTRAWRSLDGRNK
jgi:hypothetical protein